MSDVSPPDLVQRACDVLDTVVLDEYYGPGSTLDDALAALLTALAAGPAGETEAFIAALTEHRRRVLGRYALRAPMLALRAGTPELLRAGLLAHCAISRTVEDPRDQMVFFALYVHVAQVLGVESVQLFDEAAAYAVPDHADIMRTFGRRTDISLGVFGWRQVETPDGPSFETVMWNSGPSGAVVGERSWKVLNEAMAKDLLEWVASQRQTQMGPEG